VDLEPGVLTTVFGPPGIGKTTYCLLAAKAVAGRGKALFIDTEGLSPDRFAQIGAFPLVRMSPQSFAELGHQLVQIRRCHPPFRIIVLDSAAMPYRLALASGDPLRVNRQMAVHLACLTSLARKLRIPVLLSDQVYTPFGGGSAELVGGDLLAYGSKCLIELQREGEQRCGILRKHRSLPEGKRALFRITRSGFEVLPMPADTRPDASDSG
jgi:DNA repair protein RadB